MQLSKWLCAYLWEPCKSNSRDFYPFYKASASLFDVREKLVLRSAGPQNRLQGDGHVHTSTAVFDICLWLESHNCIMSLQSGYIEATSSVRLCAFPRLYAHCNSLLSMAASCGICIRSVRWHVPCLCTLQSRSGLSTFLQSHVRLSTVQEWPGQEHKITSTPDFGDESLTAQQNSRVAFQASPCAALLHHHSRRVVTRAATNFGYRAGVARAGAQNDP